MIRSLNLLLFPGREWEKMALTPPHPFVLALLSLIPMMAIGLGLEAYGLLNLETITEFGRVRLPQERVLKYIVFFVVSALLVIVFGGMLLKTVGQSFNLTAGFGACFALIAVGYSPIFLLHALDGLPAINSWICWGIGVALAFRILYHGVGLWLKPEQTKGFGLFLFSLGYIVVMSGLVHFASTQVLKGQLLKNVHLNISGQAANRKPVEEKSGHLSQMPAQPKQPN